MTASDILVLLAVVVFVRLAHRRGRWVKMLFTSNDTGSQVVVKCHGMTYVTPEAKVLSDVSFTIDRGARIALSGSNGVGKTKLVRLMLGKLKPHSGEISLGQSVKVGYLSQEHESLKSSHTVLAELTEKTGIDMTLAHRPPVWLLVPRDKMNQPVNTLS